MGGRPRSTGALFYIFRLILTKAGRSRPESASQGCRSSGFRFVTEVRRRQLLVSSPPGGAMRKVTVTNNVTLDGVMQAPAAADEDTRGGFRHGGWALPYND